MVGADGMERTERQHGGKGDLGMLCITLYYLSKRIGIKQGGVRSRQ